MRAEGDDADADHEAAADDRRRQHHAFSIVDPLQELAIDPVQLVGRCAGLHQAKRGDRELRYRFVGNEE